MAVFNQNSIYRFHGYIEKSRFCPYKKLMKWLVFKGYKIYSANTHRLYKAQLDRAIREMRKKQHVKVFISSGLAFLNACTRAQVMYALTSNILDILDFCLFSKLKLDGPWTSP